MFLREARQFWVRLQARPEDEEAKQPKCSGQTTRRAPSERVFGHRKVGYQSGI